MKKFLSLLLMSSLLLSMAACGGAEEAPAAAEEKPAAAETEKKEEAPKEEAKEEAPAAESEEGPLFAFICKDLTQEWFVGTSTAMRDTAMELGARDMLLYDCAMSPDKYLTALDNAISQEVDVLIVCPPDQNLSQITVQRCEEAGIKVMADDDGLIDENGVHIAPALELDAYKVGQGMGEYLGKYASEKGLNGAEVGYISMTMSEVSSCVPRSEGAVDKFQELYPDFPAAQIIEADYDGTTDKGFNVAAATINANPQYTTWLVTAPNDEGAQGATRALEQAGLDGGDTMVIGVGGYLGKDEFAKDYSCFKAAAYIDPVNDGEIAGAAAWEWYANDVVPYAEYAKDGAEFGVYPFGSTMVDATNYKDIMGLN